MKVTEEFQVRVEAPSGAINIHIFPTRAYANRFLESAPPMRINDSNALMVTPPPRVMVVRRYQLQLKKKAAK